MFGVIAPLLLLVAILLPLTVPLPVSIALPLAFTLVITAAIILAPFLAPLPMMMVTLVSSPPAVLVHRLAALVLLRGLMFAVLLVPLMFTAAASRTGASVRSFVPLRRLGTFRSVPSAVRTIPIGPILTGPGRGRALAVARTHRATNTATRLHRGCCWPTAAHHIAAVLLLLLLLLLVLLLATARSVPVVVQMMLPVQEAWLHLVRPSAR
uniref:Uncharacterized protein n=1 Tax=Anopheles coluzzii TaxID=1518534 RepID=A0A8W7PV37_ANOCL